MSYLELAKQAEARLRGGLEGTPGSSACGLSRDRLFQLLHAWFHHSEVDEWPMSDVRALKDAILDYWQANPALAEAWFTEWRAAGPGEGEGRHGRDRSGARGEELKNPCPHSGPERDRGS